MADDRIVDDVFQGYEKVDTVYGTQITEENIVKLATLFKGTLDWSGDKPRLTVDNKYSQSVFQIGDWISDRGRSIASLLYGGWKPMGTYTGGVEQTDE